MGINAEYMGRSSQLRLREALVVVELLSGNSSAQDCC